MSLNIEDVDLELAPSTASAKGIAERVVPVYDRCALTIGAYLKNGRPVLVRNSGEKALGSEPCGERLTRQGLWLIIKQYVDTVGIRGRHAAHTAPFLRHPHAAWRCQAARRAKAAGPPALHHPGLHASHPGTTCKAKPITSRPG